MFRNEDHCFGLYSRKVFVPPSKKKIVYALPVTLLWRRAWATHH